MGVGRVAQALHGSDNAFSAVERGDRVFVSVVFPEFPWFQDLKLRFVTCPPLVFGIPNKQFDCNMVII